MARARKKKKNDTSAAADLTPMIDVVFQLLIFFILCTRFKVEERNHQVELPKDEGLQSTPSIPKEQITIYCEWNQADKANSYLVAIDARGRVAVPQSYARITDLVIFPSDKNAQIREKKERYRVIFDNLITEIESYINRSGAKIEKLEISFAVNAPEGAVSGTAPWMFVSLAIDAAAKVNQNRAAASKEPLSVTFKFADSLERYTG